MDRLSRSLVAATGKGGCGKTSLTSNLAVLAAARGVSRVIAIDLDAQANLATAFGIKGHDGGGSLFTAAMGERATPELHETGRDGLWYVAGGSKLNRLATVAMAEGGPVKLAEWLLGALSPFADGSTVFFIDTPPSSGHALSDAALLLGESLVIPTKVDEFSIAGVGTLVERLLDLDQQTRSEWGLINIVGVVLFAVNRQATAIERQTRATLSAELSAANVRLLDAVIRATDKAQIDAIIAGVVASEYAWMARTTELPPWYETLGADPDERLSFASNAEVLASDYEAVAAEIDKTLVEGRP